MTHMINILRGIKLVFLWSGQRNDWFDQFTGAAFCLLGDLDLNFFVSLSRNLWRSNVTVSYAKDRPALDFCLFEQHSLDFCRCGCVGGLLLILLDQRWLYCE